MTGYDLDLQKAVKEVKKQKAVNVLIQLPDGLKPRAMEIADYIERNTKANVVIWAGSCWGSCDLPPDIRDIDLCIAFGHSVWPFYKDNKSVRQTRKR